MKTKDKAAIDINAKFRYTCNTNYLQLLASGFSTIEINRADARKRYTAKYFTKNINSSSDLGLFRDVDWSISHCHDFWRRSAVVYRI